MFRPLNRHEGRPWQLFWDSHNGNLTVSCLLISREACENGNGIAFYNFRRFGQRHGRGTSQVESRPPYWRAKT